MPYPLHIDQEHNKAIRAEIGERLRIFLWMAGRQKVPRPIRQSLDRLAGADQDIQSKTSPSTVPSENEGWLSRLSPRRFRRSSRGAKQVLRP
jgi:hypothetical protein